MGVLVDTVNGLRKEVKSGNVGFGPKLYNSAIGDVIPIVSEVEELLELRAQDLEDQCCNPNEHTNALLARSKAWTVGR